MTQTTTTTVTSSPRPLGPESGAEREPLAPQRLRRAMKAYTTRYAAAAIDADPEGYHLLRGDGVVPAAGDLVLARVVEIGKHTRLEGPGSRRQLLFPGQEIVVAYGDRYAPDQFLAEVPGDLGSCHLVAAGGVAGLVTEKHADVDDPTVLEPIGLLGDSAGRVTLQRHAPHTLGPLSGPSDDGPLVVAVLGTSMNSGKSTTLAALVNGLSGSGLVVSAGKATGTGAGGDPNMFRDAGATRVLDFTDFGLASTFGLDAEEVLRLWDALVDALGADGPDVVVVEIADGLYQGETSQLLADPRFAGRVDAVLFAAQDALGASAGVQALQGHGLPVIAASGVMTASPLAAGEARAALAVPVVDTYDLCEAAVARGLVTAGAQVA